MPEIKDTSLSYNLLKSIVGSGKTTFSMRTPSGSFSMTEKPDRAYIEPTLKKIEYEYEKPTVLLVSAVGATGKTALATALSSEIRLPLLDLAKHKPVGDNTLTGLLTNAYAEEDLSNIFQAIKNGSFGVIIDGIDEGRSKTTEKAFDAFLDDIGRRCGDQPSTSFVLLGRTQALDDCWLYLTEKGVRTALLSIAPFSQEDARKYIDTFTQGHEGQYRDQYIVARDYVLKNLSRAFVGKSDANGSDFVSFIGYPPVLEAIIALFKAEKNYYGLTERLKSSGGSDVEVSLLRRIACYILERERIEKVVPNLLNELVSDLPHERQEDIKKNAYSVEEQCMRLIAFSMRIPLTLQSIQEGGLNEKYEAQLAVFLADHPFIDDHQFQNAVFESLALAVLLKSKDPMCPELVLQYVSTHKHSYHLVYLLEHLLPEGILPLHYLNVLIGSALEFRSPTSSVEFTIERAGTAQSPISVSQQSIVDIDIEIVFSNDKSKSFQFRSNVNEADSIQIGSRLSSAYISVPCDLVIGGEPETDFTAPIELSAKTITLASTSLVLKYPHTDLREESIIVLEAGKLVSHLDHIITNGMEFVLRIGDAKGLTYPAITYVVKKATLPDDLHLHEKYFRLKRILMEFRSHSRGTMAKYRAKIEHERVLRGELGHKILAQLLADGVLQLQDKFYFLNPEAVDKFLGVSWHSLRRGQTDPKLIRYLQSIT
jgi:hypothetical protein